MGGRSQCWPAEGRQVWIRAASPASVSSGYLLMCTIVEQIFNAC